MAPRKTTSRKKRPTRGKSGSSTTAVMTVGAIVVLGAGALWATSQSKSPSVSVSRLFQNAMSTSSGTTHNAPVSRQTQTQPRISVQETVATAPVRRPPLNVGHSGVVPPSNPPKQLAMLAPREEPKQPTRVPTASQNSVSAQNSGPAQSSVPVAKPVPDDNSRHASGAFKVPKVVVARQALVIREKAWDQAKTVGGVEKGREMRSYAKVGRWHRVVVPSTNIIGWVQEDQLAFKNPQNHNSPLRSALAKQPALTTGSIRNKHSHQGEQAKPAAKANATAKKPHNTGLVPPVYPHQPVGGK